MRWTTISIDREGTLRKTMTMSATTTAFPFRNTLSLAPLFEFWRTVEKDKTSPRAVVARQIQKRLDETPELAQPIEDLALLDQNRDLLDLMMVAIFPAALWEESIMAVSAPFNMTPFYTTPAFDRLKIFERGCPDYIKQADFTEERFDEMRALYAGQAILEQYHQVDLPKKHPMIFTLTDEETGLDKYYKFDFNTNFTTIVPHGKPKKLSQEQIEQLLAEPQNLSLWLEMMPPKNFEFQGFIVMTATEVTDQSVLSELKDDLLRKDAMASPEKVNHLQRRLRSLLLQPDLELGLICLQRDDIEGITAAKAMGRSLLLGDTGAPACPYMGKSFYAQAYEREEPLVVGDLTSCEVCTGFEHYLKELGFRTLVLAPLRYEGKLIGMLELAVPRPNAINGLLVTKLDEAISLFATAMKRTLDEQDDRVQAIIKEHYTAIHPAVEWRFQQAAQTYLDLQATDRMAQIEPVVFNDVYPLYGLSDIRNSSSMRNKAIQDDLLEQLNLAHNVIVEAAIYRPLPVLDQISFRISQYADRIDEGASTEDETTILDFLQRDVESLFDRLATFGERVKERVEVYQAALDADLGVLYKKRHDFEESVTRLNDTVSAYLNEQEVHAQEMFPHYFELFKTDGVDYNIYVGASLVAPGPLPVTNKDIELLYLRNMRLWQLMAMCGIEWELRKLKPTLKMPLDATHLILVQSVPLSIRFRMEEKQFDVDGAYNIRYEIVKKRIDKAVIQGTQERLTQPHKIAIVYSQTKDAIVYRRYLDYLKAAGYITGEIEDFDLEPMQGVYGLKALRVTVSEEAPESSFHIEPAKIQTATKKLAVSA